MCGPSERNFDKHETTSAALAAIRESYGRIVYSHKTHEKAAERLNTVIKRVKWINLLLVVLTFGGVLNALIRGGLVGNVATTIASGLALALAIYQMSFNPGKEILEHRSTANKLWQLREEFANLIGDARDNALADGQIRRLRDNLTKRLGEVYADAPSTTAKDYWRAQQSLYPGEEMTFSKGEVERFLPPEVRESSLGDDSSES